MIGNDGRITTFVNGNSLLRFSFVGSKYQQTKLLNSLPLLFIPSIEFPEKPKQGLGGFFKNLFSSDPLDYSLLFGKPLLPQNKHSSLKSEDQQRSELLGESSSSSAEPKKTGQVRNQTSEIKQTLEQTKQKLAERGEKLDELQLRSEQMAEESKSFFENAKKLKEMQQSKWF